MKREDVIEKMATPIHEGNCCTSWEQALKSAEAALDAFLDELPVVDWECDELATYYYQQILAMRK